MPIKYSIELTDGKLYILNEDGSSTPVDIGDGEIIYEEEYAEDTKPTISFSTDPATFECGVKNNWTLVECVKCGYRFPVSIFSTLVYGHDVWLCPLHAAEKREMEKH